MSKLTVAVIFGGTSTEHEVSIVSARAVLQNLDPHKYTLLPVYITKANHWLIPPSLSFGSTDIKLLQASAEQGIAKTPQDISTNLDIDVYFPVLHGPYGEDGTIQGLLEMLKVPYVGCGVLGSAICMDKDVQKRLCREAGIPVVPYQCLTPTDQPHHVPYPCFVKPANQGSSVGIYKVRHPEELKPALQQAFKLDSKVLIEKAIENPREIECAVLGETTSPKTSVLGEIIPGNEFYDYNAKYIDGKSQSHIPAKLDESLTRKIQAAARVAFSACSCYGLARVDFLVPQDRGGLPADRVGDLPPGKAGLPAGEAGLPAGQAGYYLSELNTMPGFTTISMYPKLWTASGLSYSALLDKLIALALKRHQKRSRLSRSYAPKNDWHKN